MSVRLVVSDVDGTLVRTDKSLAQSTIDAVARLQAAGVPVAIVSSRPPRGMRYLQEALKLTGPLAGFNGGGLVGPDGKVIEQRLVPEAAARTSLGLFDSRGVSAWLFTADEWLIRDPNGPHVDHERHTVRFDPRVVDSFEPYMAQAGKLVGVTDDAPLLAGVEEELQRMLGDAANAKRSQTYYLDVTHIEANKGNAVHLLAKAQKIGVDEVAVLGDQMNDVPMFKVAGFSVAMGNAPDDVKALASAATADNDHDGWSEAVDRLIMPRIEKGGAVSGPDDLARAAAEWMVGALLQAPGPVAVALSGGSTPKRLYELLVTPDFLDRMPWDRVHWFLGDERFVPPDDSRSNYRMIRQAMLSHAPIPPSHVHPVPTVGVTPEEAAAAYERELQSFHGSADLGAKPLFEVVLMGLGTNGHTASLFPGTAALDERRAWAAAVTPEGEPTRITLTYPALESCRHAAFLVAGADKRDVLKQVRGGDQSLPAARYHPKGELRWFTDSAAEGRNVPGPPLALALQGGGSHGAYTWGVLDRVLQEAEAGRLEVAALSGASAGALNAAVLAAGLVEGGPALARTRLAEFWRAVANRGEALGNALFGFAEPGPFGYNIDWSPGAIMLEAAGLVISPYNNPFYADALTPVIAEILPPDRLARLNASDGPRVFLCALDVASNARTLFSQPNITADTLRASACLPTEFRAVSIAGTPYWDGGYIGNPALAPLVDQADDLLLILANALVRDDMPPRSARAIQERLNEVTFNASVVLELNAIAGINTLLDELRDAGVAQGRYRKMHLHLVRDDAYLASLGFVSKSSTSWSFLQALHDEGFKVATRFFDAHGDKLGRASSCDVKAELTHPVLKP